MSNIEESLILLIDNDFGFINKVKDLLFLNGFNNIIVANSCKEAISKCENGILPFLIIMEYIFMGTDGEELIKRIKSCFEETDIIVVSGSNKLSHSFSSLRHGAVAFILKNDFNRTPKMLIDSVRMWLEMNRRETVIVQKLETITNGVKWVMA